MSTSTDISELYREFTDALTRFSPRMPWVRRADYSKSGYLQAVDAAFNNWEAMQKAGR
jgi:hypothetical protein